MILYLTQNEFIFDNVSPTKPDTFYFDLGMTQSTKTSFVYILMQRDSKICRIYQSEPCETPKMKLFANIVKALSRYLYS